MKKNLHDIDKLFKAAIDDLEESPSSGVWDAIDSNLDKNKVIDIRKKYILLKRVSIVLLLLLLGFGVHTYNTWNAAKIAAMNNTIKNNEQISSIENVQGPQKEQNKITTANTSINNNADKESTVNVNNKRQAQEEDARAKMLDISQNQVLINSSGSLNKVDEENIYATRKGKILINRRTQKTNITNAAVGEYGNEMGNAGLTTEKNEVISGLSVIPEINPEILKAKPADAANEFILPGNYILGDNRNTFASPDKLKQTKKAASFAATVFYAPNISSNSIKNDHHEHRMGRPDNDGDKEKIRNGENHQSSNSAGVLLDYNMNKHWSLESGFFLSNKTIHINPKTIYADLDDNGNVKYLYNCSSGYLFLSSKSITNPVVGDSIQAFESTNTLQYISIPLTVKYNFPINRFDLFASAGTAVNILTKGKMETEIQNGPVKEITVNNKINGLKSSYFGGMLGIGALYNITGKVVISFMPSFNFALTSSTKGASVKTYPNSISMAAGIMYRL